MATPFTCEVCKYGRDVPDDYTGQHIRCPQCTAVVVVPGEPAAAPALSLPASERPCPFCKEPIKPGARKCRWCGEIIDRDLAVSMKKAEIEQIQRRQALLVKIVPNARAAFVTGLLSILLSAILLGLILGPIAIVLGVSARNEARKNPRLEGGRLAMIGIILGIIGIATTIVAIITLNPMLRGTE